VQENQTVGLGCYKDTKFLNTFSAARKSPALIDDELTALKELKEKITNK
jgi:hypothetical protein